MSRITTSFRDATPPTVAIEFASPRLAGASVEMRAGKRVIRNHAIALLADGALVPSLTATNVHDRPAVLAALKGVIEQLGNPRRIGVVIPDTVVKVSLVKFQQVPAKAEDLDHRVRGRGNEQ